MKKINFRDWEGLLYRIVKEKFNPWEIDISALADEYLKEIEKVEVDLKISGRVILAAAILLRMKIEYILKKKKQVSKRQVRKVETNPEEVNLVPILKTREFITYDELVSALKASMGKYWRRKTEVNKIEEREEFSNKVFTFDFSETIHKTYSLLMLLRKSKISFTALISGKPKEEIIDLFISILFLVKSKKIDISQDENFGEIHIIIPKFSETRNQYLKQIEKRLI